MGHDVFVSHSAKDKPTADAVCAVLESQGIRCWVAPRDIIPGKDWGESIVEAIKGARVMVLIFSTHANNSQQIKREVERAVNKGIPVIPLRIEDVAPTASLEYFLSTPHWLDAFTPPLEKHLQYLAQIIRQIIGGPATGVLPAATAGQESRDKAPAAAAATPEPPVTTGQPAAAPAPPAKKTAKVIWIAAGMLAVLFAMLILILGGWFGAKPPGPRPAQPQIQAGQTPPTNAASLAEAEQAAAREKAEKERLAEEAAKPKTLIVPGQFSTIQSAINAARAGDTIKVGAGVYDEGLRFGEGIKLIGEGKDLVRVRTPARTNVLNCDGIKKGFISGLTFEHTSKSDNTNSRVAVAFLQNGSSVEITDCRFRMGDGIGIVIKNSSPKITGCIMQENGQNGIAVVGPDARPVLIHNECRDNSLDGIVFVLGAAGETDGNVCENNRQVGIDVDGSGTAPTLKANQCRANEAFGIRFENGAAGDAEENVCGNNKLGGIDVNGSSTMPTLKANQCRANGYNGIQFQKGAAGYAERNVCENNRQVGIDVDGSGTAPTLKANQCRANEYHGIQFVNGAAGDAEENVCENNRQVGIDVDGSGTAPTLKANQCRANEYHGITFINGAAGDAERNVCENNKQVGIDVGGSGTAPTLKANQCRSNGYHGIQFINFAAGDAEENVCENNKLQGVAVFGAGTHPQIASNICRNNVQYGIFCEAGSNPRLGNDNQLTGNGLGTIITNGTRSNPAKQTSPLHW
jgi:hypothetical protein